MEKDVGENTNIGKKNNVSENINIVRIFFLHNIKKAAHRYADKVIATQQ